MDRLSLVSSKLWHGLLRRGCRLFRLHPSSLPYLSGDAFRNEAQHVHDMDSSVEPSLVNNDDMVFVQASHLDDFIQNIHPRIATPYILITHNGDTNITSSYLPYIESNTLRHWYAQNCLITHPKVTPLPIGLENKWFHLHGIPRYFDRLRKNRVTKNYKILYKFNVATNPKERGAALEILGAHPLAETYTDWRQSLSYLQTLNSYAFVASPPGNGEDCIRTWEAMYLGVIPVVKRTTMTEYFASLGLPILLINNWEEIQALNEQKLRQIYQEMTPKFNSKYLWVAEWLKDIETNKTKND